MVNEQLSGRLEKLEVDARLDLVMKVKQAIDEFVDQNKGKSVEKFLVSRRYIRADVPWHYEFSLHDGKIMVSHIGGDIITPEKYTPKEAAEIYVQELFNKGY